MKVAIELVVHGVCATTPLENLKQGVTMLTQLPTLSSSVLFKQIYIPKSTILQKNKILQ